MTESLDLPIVNLADRSAEPENMIAYIARVSNPKNQDNPSIAGLISYCIRNKHWSIFEHAFMTLEITTTLDIATQILRHRSFCFQQVSRRYAGPNEVPLKINIPELRAPHPKNRQKSIDTLDPKFCDEYKKRFKEVAQQCDALYHDMIADGVAKECARSILPQSTSTTMFMTGNCRSWIHWIALRSGNGTQDEHQRVAAGAYVHFCSVFPHTTEALGSINWKV